ncbi:hypothetical protein O3M35_000370 [Rhynocoris fuscipes]|uniref:Uncharacterized protein n=1 Tax=Rhynocoris fuscipes TaxID=488301 RepID=A0AAW1DN59_9HEMI
MIKNMRAREGDMNADDLPKEEKSRPSPASSLRRLSLAAISFFSDKQRKKNKENAQEKTRRTGNTFSRNSSSQRLSLQENDLRPDSPWGSDIYLTANEGRRPSLLDVLSPQHAGSNPPQISPVLEQTSVADLIRMASLRRLESQSQQPSQNGSRRQSRHPSLSYLFQQQPQNNRERRYSQAQFTRVQEGMPRKRAASVTPTAGGSTSALSLQPSRPTRTSAPQPPPPPPSVIVTSPDGRHRFSVHQVPSTRSSTPGGRRSRTESLSEIVSYP